MENKIKNIVTIINYTFLTGSMIVSAIANIKNSIIIIFLYFVIISSYTIRIYYIYNRYEKSLKSSCFIGLTYGAEVFIALALQSYDPHLIFLVVFIIVFEDIVLNTNYKVSIASALGIYILSSIIVYYKFIDDKFTAVKSILIIFLTYMITYIIFYLINYLLRQNEIIEKALKDINIKNIEKDNLYMNLKEAYTKVEAITALRERNKIAAEIHDTVGHTLTTVLVELEASKRLMNKDIERAAEKLNLAQGQVRKGLNDIRSSVRILERGDNLLDFFGSIEVLMQDTEKHSEVIIKANIDRSINIPKNYQEILFAALMEGLSNGIRHGNSTAFLFELTSDGDRFHFSLQDNGKGASVICPGFGLRAMKSRVEELKGTLETLSIDGEGFSLNISLPSN